MTVADLKELIESLPDDMLVIIPIIENEGEYRAVCNADSKVQTVQNPDSTQDKMLILRPCMCHENINKDIHHVDPRLN